MHYTMRETTHTNSLLFKNKSFYLKAQLSFIHINMGGTISSTLYEKLTPHKELTYHFTRTYSSMFVNSHHEVKYDILHKIHNLGENLLLKHTSYHMSRIGTTPTNSKCMQLIHIPFHRR